ncbi:MAG: glutamate 5-kinase [Clostridia bacterium]|nr:glutamate 5-kinase [Clostridia bacterium]
MRIVLKVGTSTLVENNGQIKEEKIKNLCEKITKLKSKGHEVILVSSGAIGIGVGKLGLDKKPSDIPSKQAVAAVGQCELMYVYDRIFSEFSITVGQMLLTGADLKSIDRHTNINNTLNKLLQYGVLPVINENDSIATDEIKVGDNDTLSAIVATSVNADLLIILSDVNGLYSADPRKDKSAKLIKEVYELTDEILALAGGEGSSLGTGGMVTKLKAAKICLSGNCDMAISNGENLNLLEDIVENKSNEYTRFYCKRS